MIWILIFLNTFHTSDSDSVRCDTSGHCEEEWEKPLGIPVFSSAEYEYTYVRWYKINNSKRVLHIWLVDNVNRHSQNIVTEDQFPVIKNLD